MKEEIREARIDCRGILWRLSRDQDKRTRWFLLADLLTKSDLIPAGEREEWKLAAYRRFIGVRPENGERALMRNEKRLIGCLVIKPRELTGVLGHFGVSLSKDLPFLERDGFRFWVVDVEAVRFAVMLVGEERGHNIGPALRVLLREFPADLLVLCGVAAGVREKVGLGDVVIAERVGNFEGGVVLPDGTVPRPEWIELPEPMARDVAFLEAKTRGQIINFDLTMSRLAKAGLTKDEDDTKHAPRLVGGTILSGEKNFQDDRSLSAMRTAMDERTRALDQESWMFAWECRGAGVPWMVFRGISDFASQESFDPRGGTEDRSGRQIRAAAAAAAALELFVVEAFKAR